MEEQKHKKDLQAEGKVNADSLRLGFDWCIKGQAKKSMKQEKELR